MGAALTQKQQISLFQANGLSVDNVRRFSTAHIHHFHIIVGMLREVDEPGMWADGDELTGGKQLSGIDGTPLPLHVQFPVDGCPAIQYRLFLRRNALKSVQNTSIHSITPRVTFFAISISQADLLCP